MSCNNSEHGRIEFTKTGYQQFLRAIRTAFNDHYAKAFSAAEVAYKHLAAISGRGALERQRALFDSWLYVDRWTARETHELRIPTRHVMLDDQLVDLIRSELFRGKDGGLTKPRKSAFPKFINTQQEIVVPVTSSANFTLTLYATGAGSAHWAISENNRAVEEVRSTGTYQVLIDVLHAYKWKRHEGGCWYYMDEYDEYYAREDGRECRSQISAEWGPLGKQESDQRLDAQLARFGAARRKTPTRRGGVKKRAK